MFTLVRTSGFNDMLHLLCENSFFEDSSASNLTSFQVLCFIRFSEIFDAIGESIWNNLSEEKNAPKIALKKGGGALHRN